MAVRDLALSHRRTVFFTPKEDITAYELALFVQIVVQALAGAPIWDEGLDSLPETIKRHLTITESK